jgi:hypothetical protein
MSKEKQTFIESLIKAQSEIGKVYKEKINPHFKNKYVPLNSILEEIKPTLNDNGFFLTQKICVEGDQEVLKTELLHISGECLNSVAPLNIADKNNPQKYGSAITYMRRYTLTALLGLEEEDDDGKRATQENKSSQKISDQQLSELENLLDSASKDKIEFCKAMKINSLSDLPNIRFQSVVDRLNQMIKENANN